MSKISERIKEARETLGVSQAELAGRSQLTPAAISQFEKGARTPSLKTLGKLAEALEVSINYLIGTEQMEESFPSEVQAMFRGLQKMTDKDKEEMFNFYQFLKAKKNYKIKKAKEQNE